MKLRLANKILSAVGGPNEKRYTDHQIVAARRRHDRTRSARESKRFFSDLVMRLGVNGRAEVLTRCGAPGMAFGLLMREGK